MKILLAVHQFPPQRVGGAELLALRTAHWLIDHGHRVQVVCVGNAADASQDKTLGLVDEVYEGVPVRRLYFNWWNAPRPFDWTFDNPLIEAHLESMLRADPPDLVHLISGYLITAAPLRTAHRFAIPSVVTLTDFWFLCPTLQLLRVDGSLCTHPEPVECLHCSFVSDRRARIPDALVPRLTRPMLKVIAKIPALANRFDIPARLSALERRPSYLVQTLDQTDAVVSITRFVAEMHVANGVHPNRIGVIPDCVDRAEFDHASRVRSVEATVHFGYLGQIVPVKGVDILIRAFRRLDRSRRRARLFVWGPLEGDPAYTCYLRQLAGDEEDIVFAGRYPHRDVIKILADLDVLVVPSRWYENSPRVILESFNAQCPVIGTNLGGISEVVQHNGNGLLFERDDVGDLLRQMQRVLDEPGLIPQLRTGIPIIRGVDEAMTDLLTVYRRVIAERPVGGKAI